MSHLFDMVSNLDPRMLSYVGIVAATGLLRALYCVATSQRLPFQRALFEAVRGQAPGIFKEVDVKVRQADGTEKLERRETRKASRFFFRRQEGLLYIKPRRGYGRREIVSQLDKYAEEFLAPGSIFAGVEEVTAKIWRLLGWRYVLYVDRTSAPVRKAIEVRVAEKKST